MPRSKFQLQNQKIVKSLAAIGPHTLSPPGETAIPDAVLQSLCPDGNITPSVCAKIMEFSQKEKLVREKCDLSKVKVRPDDGRIYLIVKRKTISSINYPGLIDKLYDHFYGIQNCTLDNFFEIWMKWRDEETSTSKKTIKENRFLWNALLKDREITKIPIKELKVQDYIAYFRSITKDRQLTRKRFNDLKSILNSMLYLAVEKGIINHNCLRDINYKQFAFKAENHDIRPYTEKERLQIIAALSKQCNDFYSLAILLDFHLVLRISELKGLKWSDIHGNSIRIQRFVNDKNEIVDDIKGHTEFGRRDMPLTPAAKIILEKIRQLNPDSEYILIRNGQPLSTCTFNRRLKKCCKELGIEYRSSHGLRFSTASIMYKNGVEDTELQKLLGHTTLSMTRHYLRNLSGQDELTEKMSSIQG